MKYERLLMWITKLALKHRRRKLPKSVWAMASAVARVYNGGLRAEPPEGVQGQSPPGQGRSPLKLVF